MASATAFAALRLDLLTSSGLSCALKLRCCWRGCDLAGASDGSTGPAIADMTAVCM